MSASFLVHGMGSELVDPTFPPLRLDEVRDVLTRVGLRGGAAATLAWRSPRPFAATALVELPAASRAAERLVVVKRHHGAVRGLASLAGEHALLGHLLARGARVPSPLGILGTKPWSYEVLTALEGGDWYREAPSWTPLRSSDHARAAGEALARLHLAAAGHRAPERPFGPLVVSCALAGAEDLLGATAALVATRPVLGCYLSARPWRSELAEHLLPWHRELRARLGVARADSGSSIGRSSSHHAGATAPLWTHGDWHPSNLLWNLGRDGGARVVGAIDFGLCNRTFALHDLATALERSTVGWLEPAETRTVSADLAAALVAGYVRVLGLRESERLALAALLPLVHVEYALSEVEYFAGVADDPTSADLAFEDYLLGHADFFATARARELLEAVVEPVSARRGRGTAR